MKASFGSRNYVRLQRGALLTGLVSSLVASLSLVKLAFAGHFLGSDIGLVAVALLIAGSGWTFAWVGERTGFWKDIDLHSRSTGLAPLVSAYDKANNDYLADKIVEKLEEVIR